MEITFYLRVDRLDKDGKAPIHMRVCWHGNKVRTSTGDKVLVSDWDESKEKVKGRRQFSADINSRLDTYSTKISQFIYQTQNKGQVVTEDLVRDEFKRIRTEDLGKVSKHNSKAEPKANTNPDTLATFLESYEKELPGGLTSSTTYQIKAIRQHMNAFLPGFDWADLQVNTLNQLKNYLSEEIGLSDNSVAAYFGSFRGALKYATILKKPVPADYTLVSASPAEVTRPTLSREHLAKLDKVDLSDSVALYRTNWLFRMACYTGLRHSDLVQARFSSVRIVDGHPCLIALQQKAEGTVAVPLVDEAIRLLELHPNGFKPAEKAWYNLYLKQIGKRAGLTDPVTVSSRYKGKLIHTVIPLCDTLASHTARRTFASLLLEGGLNTRVLQSLMGHASITSTEKYAKIPTTAVLDQTFSAWEASNKKKTVPKFDPMLKK